MLSAGSIPNGRNFVANVALANVRGGLNATLPPLHRMVDMAVAARTIDMDAMNRTVDIDAVVRTVDAYSIFGTH